MKNFIRTVLDIVRALLRLVLMMCRLVISGLDQILFNNSEVANISLICVAQRREQEKIAYIDKLIENNIDLALHQQVPPSNFIPFQEDSEYDDDEPFDEDNDDGDSNPPVK
jgi:hypothetical protein